MIVAKIEGVEKVIKALNDNTVLPAEVLKLDVVGSQFVIGGSREMYGEDLIVNGRFEEGVLGWSLGDGWAIPAETADCDGTVGGSVYQDVGAIEGRNYLIEGLSLNYISGILQVGGSVNFLSVSADGLFYYVRQWTSDPILYLRSNDTQGFLGSIDNISVREVL